jgi:multidrug efflux system membrane fusion protein
MKRSTLVLGLLALAAIGAYHFGLVRWPTSGSAEKETVRGHGRRGFDGPVAVNVAPVRIADVPVTIDAVGTVQALNTVTVRTQVDGRLIKLGFEEGQEVRKGDVIAQIDPTLYQAAYDQAVAKKAQDEANLENARVDVLRYQKLAANNFGSQQQYATQKALVAQLEAQIRADQGAIDNAKAMLDYATIRSPIDGRTGIRLVDVGNILHASDQTGIVVITQMKPIFVVFTVPQQSLPAVHKAQAQRPATVAALGADNATVLDTGVVTVIDNQIDQATGTVRIKATFDNRQLSLWPGQFVNVRVTVDTIRQARVVPSAAVQRGPSGAFVYVVNADETVSMKPVSIGRQDEHQAVVTSELEAGTRVVTNGFVRLMDGARVRVAEPPAAPAEAPTASNTEGDAVAAPPAQPRQGQKHDPRSERRGERNSPTRTR